MNELNYSLYIDESGVSSKKLVFNNEIEKRSFFALGSLKAQKKDINEFYKKYLKKFEINEEIKYKDLKKDKDTLNIVLSLIEDADFEINIEFVESQLYYLALFCDYVLFPWWLTDNDIIEMKQKFFHNFSDQFDIIFFNLLNTLFISNDLEQYEKAYMNLIPFLTENKIMSEIELLKNLRETKDLINNSTYSFQNIKPLGNKYNNKSEIIVLPHLQCLYNLIIKAGNVKSIIHDENLHYQKIFKEDIKKNLKKNIIFKNSKSECGLKVIDIVISYCKNTIEYMIKNNDYTEMHNINMFINNINFITNKASLTKLYEASDKDYSSIFKILKRKN